MIRHQGNVNFSLWLFIIFLSKNIHLMTKNVSFTENKTRLPFTRVDYQFKSTLVKFTISPHGNAKICSQHFFKTKASTHQSIKESRSQCSPRHIFDQMMVNAGGILNADSETSFPRNVKQVYNRKAVETESKDPYNILIILCKEE